MSTSISQSNPPHLLSWYPYICSLVCVSVSALQISLSTIFPISHTCVQFISVQFLIRIRLFATPWTAACQASLSITNSRSSPKLISIESVLPSSHLILCHPLLFLPSIPPSIRVFSNESTLHMRWPKYWEVQIKPQLYNTSHSFGWLLGQCKSNHNYIILHIHLDGYYQERKQKIHVSRDEERLEPLCSVWGSVKWSSHCGKQYGSSSKKLNIELPHHMT